MQQKSTFVLFHIEHRKGLIMTEERRKQIGSMSVKEFMTLTDEERKEYYVMTIQASNKHFAEYCEEHGIEPFRTENGTTMKKYKIEEYSRKVAIYEMAEKLLQFMNYPCVLVYRDYKDELHVLESTQPFVDSFDFELDEE